MSVEIFRPQYWSRSPLQVARQARAASLRLLRGAGLA